MHREHKRQHKTGWIKNRSALILKTYLQKEKLKKAFL